MSSLLWVALWSVLLMVGTTISISVLSKIMIKRYPTSAPVFPVSALVFMAGCLGPAVWVAVQLNRLAEVGVLAVIMSGIWLCLFRLNGIKREAVLLALCLIATILIPTDLTLFTVMPAVVVYGILGVSLYLMMRVFAVMDCVSGLSMMTLLAQGLLIVLMAHIGLLPKEIPVAAFYVFVVVMSIAQTIKVFSKGFAVLGDFAASLAGFVAGYIWIYVMAKGYPFIPAVLYSYDVFEIVLAGVMSFIATRHFCPRAVPFLLEKAMASGVRPKKLTRFVFLVLVLTSFLSALFISEAPVFKSIVIVQVIILAGTYYMLNGWAVPRPTFKDLAGDLKHGFADLKEQINQLPLKEKKSPKKTGTKKK